jgi:hypothetical protein
MARRQYLPIGDVVSSCARIGHRSGDESERSSETRTARGFVGGRLGVRRPFDRSVLASRMGSIDGDVCEWFVSWLGRGSIVLERLAVGWAVRVERRSLGRASRQ